MLFIEARLVRVHNLNHYCSPALMILWITFVLFLSYNSRMFLLEQVYFRTLFLFCFFVSIHSYDWWFWSQNASPRSIFTPSAGEALNIERTWLILGHQTGAASDLSPDVIRQILVKWSLQGFFFFLQHNLVNLFTIKQHIKNISIRFLRINSPVMGKDHPGHLLHLPISAERAGITYFCNFY